MANWYQRKPTFDATLIALIHTGRLDLVVAALELSLAICESESDAIPLSVAPFVEELAKFRLMQTSDDLLHFLRMKRKHRGADGVVPRSTTEYHEEPRGYTVAPDKRRVEKRREEENREEENREILQPELSDLDNAGAREAKPEPSFDEFQAMGRAVLEAQRKAHGIRSIK